jgi:hypothetical protein
LESNCTVVVAGDPFGTSKDIQLGMLMSAQPASAKQQAAMAMTRFFIGPVQSCGPAGRVPGNGREPKGV